MPSFNESIATILDALAGRVESGPGQELEHEPGTFEAVAVVFLSRSGNARAVASAVDALRESGRLDPVVLADADPAVVEESWREAGARSLVKQVRPLQRLARWAIPWFDGGRVGDDVPTEPLREGLRSLNGVGPATADIILLEAIGRHAYPVDRATYRILVRHGWLDSGADYDEARSVVEGALIDDPATLARLAHRFERLGREACRASVARCDRCPLRPLLPEGGPLEAG